MDIRKINTINRIKNGFFLVLENKKLADCSTNDIVEKAQISKKSFYNYFKNKNELLDSIETDLLNGIQTALDQDRDEQIANLMQSHQPNNDSNHFENVMEPVLDHTLTFCNEHVKDFAILLSSNGDIYLQNRILELGTVEADLRFKIILGQEKMSSDILNSQRYQLARTIMSNVVYTIFKFWIQHYQTMSLEDLRVTVYKIQQESLSELMQSVLFGQDSANNETKTRL